MAAGVGAPVAFALGHGLVPRGVEEIGKLLNPVNQPGCPDAPTTRLHPPQRPEPQGVNTATGQVVGQSGRTVPVVAARSNHHHTWLRSFNVVPRDPPRRRARGAPITGSPSANQTISGIQCPGANGGVGPLQHRTRGRG